MEPLLKENPYRFSLFPIEHQPLWDMYKTHQQAYWKAEEIDFSRDRDDFERLDGDAQHFIKNVLGFFATADGIVSENLVENFMNEVQYPEAKAFYGFQTMMEFIHAHTYALQLQTLIEDPTECESLFKSIDHIPCIQAKAQWALKWLSRECSFAERLIAFAIVEGVFFSSSFCAIYWIQELGLMPGLTLSNQFIARDEGLHTQFAVLLYNNYIQNKIPQDRIHQIVSEAVETEARFVEEALRCDLVGMNSTLMIQYVKFVADGLLRLLNQSPLYGVNNPFDFMERLSIEGKTNFFESRVSEYADSHVGKQKEFRLDEDF
jgi:ribonucleoside-diphosphate reductase beta chain